MVWEHWVLIRRPPSQFVKSFGLKIVQVPKLKIKVGALIGYRLIIDWLSINYRLVIDDPFSSMNKLEGYEIEIKINHCSKTRPFSYKTKVKVKHGCFFKHVFYCVLKIVQVPKFKIKAGAMIGY